MTDSPGHLDLDALADVLAGERDDAHLRTCPPCTDRLAELSAADASTTAALAALPAPPLPAGLSARLTRALQEERRRELATVRPLRRRPPAWLPAAAASVVLALAGAVGWSLLDLPGRGGQEAASIHAGGGQDTASEPEAATGLAVPRTGTATDWADEASRPAALSRLLGATGPPASSATAGPSGEGLDRLRDPAALAACLAGLPGGGDDVLAVDYAQYGGAPAVAIVQPDGPDLVQVTVVGSGCSAAEPEILTGLSLPRP